MTAQNATAAQTAKSSALAKQTETPNALERFEQVYDSIAKRAFEIFESNGRGFGNELSDWFRAESEILHPMHLEIDESDQSLNVRAEVPGFTAKELDIEVEGDRLTISGKHEAKEENTKGQTIYAERCSNRIFRSIRLPSHVDGPKAKATLKDGILSIELPKADHGKSVRIEPKAAS